LLNANNSHKSPSNLSNSDELCILKVC